MRKHISRTKSHRAANTAGSTTSDSIYQRVTQRIIDALEQGVVPWRKEWRGASYMPCNLISKRPYHGVNLLLLGSTPFTDHRWLTMRQANELGGHVRRGEKSSFAVFWKQLEIEPDDIVQADRRRTIPLLRYYHLFNVEQCDGLNLPRLTEEGEAPRNERIEAAERVVISMPNPPHIREGGSSASYRPSADLVHIPRIADFTSAEAYYATLYHELGHATGHESRLNRSGVTSDVQFGSYDYSREELIAELASAFCCAEVGIDNSILDNAASYIHGWLGALQSDPKAVVIAAGQAQRAVDYIRNVSEPDFGAIQGPNA